MKKKSVSAWGGSRRIRLDRVGACLAMVAMAVGGTLAAGGAPETGDRQWVPPPTARDFYAAEPQLELLIAGLLQDNPTLGGARAQWRSMLGRPAQERALPDPELQVRYFARPVETRVGPTRFSIGLYQGLPWLGKRRLEGERAWTEATGFGWDVRALARDLVAALKRTYYEVAYYQQALEIKAEERALLERFEQIALTQYATGQGIQQRVVKVQTEITRVQDEETALREARELALRRMGKLLGRGGGYPDLEPIELGPPRSHEETLELEEVALHRRPEIHAAQSRIDADNLWVQRRSLESRPDFRVGLEYTDVGSREDAAGRSAPPEGNGVDSIAVIAALNIPVARGRIRAGVQEAQESVHSSQLRLEDAREQIRFDVAESHLRLDSLTERWKLYREVLIPQAEESLAAAEAAYVTNRLGFLDLLDAERVLFRSQVTMHRLLADVWAAAADLERALGRPFPDASGWSEEVEE